MNRFFLSLISFVALLQSTEALCEEQWCWTKAHVIPKETTSEGSGYFSIIESQDEKLLIGTAKYRHNAYLVEFTPKTGEFQIVVDCQKEIGTTETGFAAQAKIHTRNNIGPSGRIYFGTKQGYPKEGESRSDYRGGYPMVYDPKTKATKVYPIPIPHQGIISVTPDERRNIAYVSTCDDSRPVESSHFMILDLETGKYRDLLETHHMYAFIVVDYLGRAYHPIQGGEIARYDPRSDSLIRLKQRIDGEPPTQDSLLAHPDTHPINWDISHDGKTLFAVPMNNNGLYAYDLTAEVDHLPGKKLAALLPEATKTDCRAMCVGPDGTVWCGVAATLPGQPEKLRLLSFRTAEGKFRDHGALAVSNPDFTNFKDESGKELAWHHGFFRDEANRFQPHYSIMGICAARSGKVYVTTLAPFTLHEIEVKE